VIRSIMKLNRNSRAFKWAYLWENPYYVHHTSLCNLFWRTVLITPLKLAFPLVIAACLVVVAWSEPLNTLIVLAIVISLPTTCILWDGVRRRYNNKEPGIIVGGFKAVKSKICPIVSIED
jgi:ABC-type sugar transport system permease subunit